MTNSQLNALIRKWALLQNPPYGQLTAVWDFNLSSSETLYVTDLIVYCRTNTITPVRSSYIWLYKDAQVHPDDAMYILPVGKTSSTIGEGDVDTNINYLTQHYQTPGAFPGIQRITVSAIHFDTIDTDFAQVILHGWISNNMTPEACV